MGKMANTWHKDCRNYCKSAGITITAKKMIVLIRLWDTLQSWRNWWYSWWCTDHLGVSEPSPMIIAPFPLRSPFNKKVRKTLFVQACISMSKNLQLYWNTQHIGIDYNSRTTHSAIKTSRSSGLKTYQAILPWIQVNVS